MYLSKSLKGKSIISNVDLDESLMLTVIFHMN
jgi:hypothetical protein